MLQRGMEKGSTRWQDLMADGCWLHAHAQLRSRPSEDSSEMQSVKGPNG